MGKFKNNQQHLRHQNRNPKKRNGKRNQQQVVNDRWEEKSETGKVVNEKHHAQRLQYVRENPVRPLNQQQSEYIYSLKNYPYNLALGYAGTSKSYIATRVAIEEFLKGNIDKIVIVRPAVSESKSLGFFGGDKMEKMKNWILPVLEILEEFLGVSYVEYLLARGVIEGVPLETIKGRSFKRCFIIIDEVQDMKKSEIKKCITRLGSSSVMVFAGDLRQVDIKESGMKFILDTLLTKPSMQELWGVVDFDSYDEIVRSEAVKATIIAMAELGEM